MARKEAEFMRKIAALLLMLTLVLVGCSKPKSPPPAAEPSEPPPPVVVEPTPTPVLPAGPDLMEVSSSYDLTIDELRAGLIRYLSQGEGSVADRLTALYDHWQLQVPENHIRLAEADLDDDGQVEVVTALNGSGALNGMGQVFVIARAASGGVTVEPVASEPETGVYLFDVRDLTGDGEPEILWSTTMVGAHTGYTSLNASRWRPGASETLPGIMVMASARIELEEHDVLFTGGQINSVGAGMQRSRVDRYRWTGERFELVDRRYADSSLGYFRLIDGIVAETFGHADEATQAFRDAMADADPNLTGLMIEPEKQAGFVDAVRAFARFRLGALLLSQGQADEAGAALAADAGPFAELPALLARAGEREAGCKAAVAWAQANPGFLEALNSAYGYAQPVWQPEDLCGPLPKAAQ